MVPMSSLRCKLYFGSGVMFLQRMLSSDVFANGVFSFPILIDKIGAGGPFSEQLAPSRS